MSDFYGVDVDVEKLSAIGEIAAVSVDDAAYALGVLGLVCRYTDEELAELYPCRRCSPPGRELVAGITGLYYRRCPDCGGSGWYVPREREENAR